MIEERRSSAGTPAPPRVRVITTPALLGVTALILAVLAMVFPRDVLVSRLAANQPRPIESALAGRAAEPAVLGVAPSGIPLPEIPPRTVPVDAPTPADKKPAAPSAATPELPRNINQMSADEQVRFYIEQGNYRAAADVLFGLQRRASTLALRRERFLAALKILQSSDRLTEMLDAADAHLDDLADDEITLQALVRLALGANDQDRAQRYARQLVRIQPPNVRSDLQRGAAWGFLALLITLVPSAQAQGATETASVVVSRPYNETSYTLAFDVFVGNSNFADARRVAEAALAQRPNDLAWRRRLAQVLEWAGDPQAALREWRLIAERTKSAESLQAVLRLAPGLGDDNALLDAWIEIARVGPPQNRPLTAGEIDLLTDLFERTGRIDEGLAYFRERFARANRPEYLERVGVLADRVGRTEEAIAAFEALAARGELTVARAITLATLYMKRGDFKGAFNALDRVRDKVSESETPYWRLFGNLAWQLGNEPAAADAYRRLSDAKQVEPFEFIRMLRMMRRTQPLEAAHLAEEAWLRTRDPQFFYTAVETYAMRHDLAALDRLFGSIDPADAARFRSESYFYVLRSNWYRDRARGGEALADFRRAMALKPNDTALRVSYLWLAIDARDLTELRRVLQAFHRDGANDRALWPALAAGWQVLGEPRRALAFYRLAAAERQDDYLWLMSYADALENANEGGLAWRLRRHAWTTLRTKVPAKPASAATPAELATAARLAIYLTPGDPSFKVIRQVLSQSALGSGNAPLDAATRELVLSYAISAGEFDRARAWLWTQYGRSLARPLWAEVAVALEQNDVETLERLMAGNPRALPRYDRIDAARAVGALGVAQTLAFESQESYPADDEMHLRLEQNLRANASSAVGTLSAYRFGPLEGVASGFRLNYWLTPQLRLTPFAANVTQRLRDTGSLVDVPSNDRTLGIETLWRTERTDTTARLATRSAIEDIVPFELIHQRRYPPRLSTTIAAGRNLLAAETAALRVGGAKDELRFSFNYDVSKREYVAGGVASSRYYTQARTNIGSSNRYELETGYRIRTDYPNFTARLNAVHYQFDRADTTDEIGRRLNPAGTVPAGSFFLPVNFTVYAAGIGFGQYLREEYTRGIRPFADVGVLYNSVTGAGFNVVAGAGGSVFGSDHLSFGAGRGRGGTGINTTSSEVFLRYQLYF